MRQSTVYVDALCVDTLNDSGKIIFLRVLVVFLIVLCVYIFVVWFLICTCFV